MTTQQKVFIGGAGWQPLMNTLVPKTATIGNIFTWDAAIETPTKKYTVHFKINMERDTLISDLEKTASSARIERICGVSIVESEQQTVSEEINGQLMECKTSTATFKADDDAEPTSGQINAVSLLGFGEVFATVDVSDLTDEKLLAYQEALKRLDVKKVKTKLPPRDYSKRPPTMKEWAICETLMLGMIEKKEGITPYAIQHAMPEKWMQHPQLKDVRRPCDGVFKKIAHEVKKTGRIRRAHRKRDHVKP